MTSLSSSSSSSSTTSISPHDAPIRSEIGCSASPHDAPIRSLIGCSVTATTATSNKNGCTSLSSLPLVQPSWTPFEINLLVATIHSCLKCALENKEHNNIQHDNYSWERMLMSTPESAALLNRHSIEQCIIQYKNYGTLAARQQQQQQSVLLKNKINNGAKQSQFLKQQQQQIEHIVQKQQEQRLHEQRLHEQRLHEQQQQQEQKQKRLVRKQEEEEKEQQTITTNGLADAYMSCSSSSTTKRSSKRRDKKRSRDDDYVYYDDDEDDENDDDFDPGRVSHEVLKKREANLRKRMNWKKCKHFHVPIPNNNNNNKKQDIEKEEEQDQSEQPKQENKVFGLYPRKIVTTSIMDSNHRIVNNNNSSSNNALFLPIVVVGQKIQETATALKRPSDTEPVVANANEDADTEKNDQVASLSNDSTTIPQQQPSMSKKNEEHAMKRTAAERQMMLSELITLEQTLLLGHVTRTTTTTKEQQQPKQHLRQQGTKEQRKQKKKQESSVSDTIQGDDHCPVKRRYVSIASGKNTSADASAYEKRGFGARKMTTVIGTGAGNNNNNFPCDDEGCEDAEDCGRSYAPEQANTPNSIPTCNISVFRLPVLSSSTAASISKNNNEKDETSSPMEKNLLPLSVTKQTRPARVKIFGSGSRHLSNATVTGGDILLTTTTTSMDTNTTIRSKIGCSTPTETSNNKENKVYVKNTICTLPLHSHQQEQQMDQQQQQQQQQQQPYASNIVAFLSPVPHRQQQQQEQRRRRQMKKVHESNKQAALLTHHHHQYEPKSNDEEDSEMSDTTTTTTTTSEKTNRDGQIHVQINTDLTECSSCEEICRMWERKHISGYVYKSQQRQQQQQQRQQQCFTNRITFGGCNNQQQTRVQENKAPTVLDDLRQRLNIMLEEISSSDGNTVYDELVSSPNYTGKSNGVVITYPDIQYPLLTRCVYD